MKTKTTFTSEFTRRFESLIFITTMDGDFSKEWEILTDIEGNTFDDIDEAIKFVRSQGFKWGIGLSTFEQVKMENAEWDNF